MKKVISVLLIFVLCFGMLSACANNAGGENTTEKLPPDDGVLRVLIIGHSLGNDSTWLLPQIAKNEGLDNLVVGMLYYSGCRLGQHVQFSLANAAKYNYRQFDLSKDTTWQIADANGAYWDGGTGAVDLTGRNVNQTMKFAIEAQDWDIVVLQAGVFEASGKKTTDGLLNLTTIQGIMNYVNDNDVDKSTPVTFGWNMTWTMPADYANTTAYTYKETYHNHLKSAFSSSYEMYQSIADTLQNQIMPKYNFKYMMPAGTTIENIKSSYIGDKVYRDYIHVYDFGRLAAAYTWLCTLTGKDMSQMKIDPIQSYHLVQKSLRDGKVDLTLTETEKNILIESVTNALKTPYAMTQSAYTQKPAQ